VRVQLTAQDASLNAAGGMGVLSLVGHLIRQPQHWFGLRFVLKKLFSKVSFFWNMVLCDQMASHRFSYEHAGCAIM
jgi:hypothetical protein